MPELDLNVLVVDDDEVSRFALAAAVEVVARAPRTADSLRTARDAVAGSVPDVVLLDLSLPDGDGVELLADLAGTRCRVICVSGHVDPRSSRDALDKGACAYLTKPVDIDRLWTLLRDAALEVQGPRRDGD